MSKRKPTNLPFGALTMSPMGNGLKLGLLVHTSRLHLAQSALITSLLSNGSCQRTPASELYTSAILSWATGLSPALIELQTLSLFPPQVVAKNRQRALHLLTKLLEAGVPLRSHDRRLLFPLSPLFATWSSCLMDLLQVLQSPDASIEFLLYSQLVPPNAQCVDCAFVPPNL